jgi:hypothetical protein
MKCFSTAEISLIDVSCNHLRAVQNRPTKKWKNDPFLELKLHSEYLNQSHFYLFHFRNIYLYCWAFFVRSVLLSASKYFAPLTPFITTFTSNNTQNNFQNRKIILILFERIQRLSFHVENLRCFWFVYWLWKTLKGSHRRTNYLALVTISIHILQNWEREK